MRWKSKVSDIFSYSCLWIISLTGLPIMNAYSDQTNNIETKFEFKDPQQRDAIQLLESAKSTRSANRLSESVALAYLALKVAETEKNTSIEAHSHLFLSETMSKFGYRAMERIHAKAAYRVITSTGSSALGDDLGPFYNRLGVVAGDTGDFSIASFYLNKALIAYESKGPGDKKAIVLTLLELAKLSLKKVGIQHALEIDDITMLQRSQAYVDQAIELAKVGNGNPELEGAILDLQAPMILRMSAHIPVENKDIAKNMLGNAEKLLRESLDRHKSHANNDLQEQIPIMNNLVSTLRRQGRYVEAMDVTENILKITDKLQRIDVDTALNMALVAKNLSNEDLIRTLCNIVMNSEEFQIEEVTSKSGEALALAYSAQSRYRSMTCLALLSTLNTEDDNNARLMLDLVLRRKAIVMESEGSFWDTIHEQSDADLSRARATLISLRNQLSTKVVTGDMHGLWKLIQEIEHGEELLSVEPGWREFQKDSSGEEQQALKGYADSLLNGMSSWEARSAQEYNFDKERITIDVVAKHVPRDTVVVEFAKINDFDLDREIFLTGSHYWAFILRANGKTEAINLGEASYIESQVSSHLKMLLSTDPLLAEPQLQAMSNLYDVVWAPLADKLGKEKNIILSPDSVYALVPFGALLAPDGQFLIEKLTLYQIATSRELVATKPAQPGNLNRPVIIADPDFDANSMRSSQNHRRNSKRAAVPAPLNRLESTIKEANKVRELLGDDVEFITDKEATEATVRLVKSPKILHMATHGVFLEQTTTSLEETSEEDAVALESAYLQHVQALSLSGLALNGINHGGLSNDEDGLLTAFDVAGMDLSGTELVVLSACDTGLGNLLAGEGVLGLRRAFHIAGAKYVLMTLWQLSDKEAVRQIREFYPAYLAGENPAEALRDTQRARISKLRKVLGRAPPALWGAFIIQGVNN